MVAGTVWFVAGFILFERSIAGLAGEGIQWYWIVLSVLAGLGFFFLLFMRISFRHIHRIRSMDLIRPCIFSFFNFRSYILMCVMILAGILMRKSGIIGKGPLSLLYLAMGIPLLISAARFFLAWRKYPQYFNEGIHSSNGSRG